MYVYDHVTKYQLIAIFKISLFIYFEREREREREHKLGRGREVGQSIRSGLCADSREPDAGLKLMNCEIMTQAEVGSLTG